MASKQNTKRLWLRFAMVAFTTVTLISCDSPEPVIRESKPMLRLISEEQYRNIVADVFGPQIIVAGPFDPILREEALIAISAASTTISASSFEKYERSALSVATQVVDPVNRKLLVGCTPTQTGAADDACARQFLKKSGLLLFRRPLADAELQSAVMIAQKSATSASDFYEGLAYGLASLMVSPNFLFISDDVVSGEGGQSPQLSAYSKATRLSFFLWNTTPDKTLLEAASRGDLETQDGIDAQIERLLNSPSVNRGVRALFSDMLELEKFDRLTKDPLIYPAFDMGAVEQTREQLLRTITHHLLERNADYRGLFNTRQTFMTPALGRIYRVPVSDLEGWSSFEFPTGQSYVGIQTLAGFLAPHSHPGRSSPTIRGRAVRELLLCQRVPDPPGDIDFTLFNEPSSEQLVARDRLAAHNSVPSCAGCHKLTDGIGLALENFDGAGQFRTVDVGQAIDISGDLDGISFATVDGLADALHDHPMVPACLVQRAVAYATAGAIQGQRAAWENHLLERFRKSGYRLRPLLLSIASSPNFFAVGSPNRATTSQVSATPESYPEKRQ